ncbi:MAG: dipeptidase PepV [Bacilli bacterium]
MDFLKIVEPYQNALLHDLQQLCRIDTTLIEQPDNLEAPFGQGLRDALDYILRLGKAMGFKTKKIDQVAGYIEYGEGLEIVGVLAHLDVVPAGDGWRVPPFSATIEGDRLYARGAMDDKGPLMASLYALKLLKDNAIPVSKRIRIIIGTDEETSWRGIAKYMEKCEIPSVGFSPDAEFPIIYGEKGILSIDLFSDYKDETLVSLISGDRYNVVPETATAVLLGNHEEQFLSFSKANLYHGKAEVKGKETLLKMFGKSAHAMEPDAGVNALLHMMQFLALKTKNPLVNFVASSLKDSRFRSMNLAFSDPEMKDLTVNVALAAINQQGGRVGLNLRYPIHWDKEAFIKRLQEKAGSVKVKVIKDSVPHYVAKDSIFVKTLHEAYIKYTGDRTSPLMTIGGGTYARAFKNCVAFGMLMPGREEVVHQVNEYLIISDLMKATAIYAEAMSALAVMPLKARM